jgi:hypothetical protein
MEKLFNLDFKHMGRSYFKTRVIDILMDHPGEVTKATIEIEKVFMEIIMDTRKATSPMRDKGYIGGWNGACDQMIAQLGGALPASSDPPATQNQ